ncbi:MAG: GldG family protein [Treponema sp.]|nr:GldG family protein [Treponema sp.]
MMTRKQHLFITVLASAVFVLVLMVSSKFYFRLDFTSGRTFTLSEISKNLYQKLDDMVQITYFVSDRLVSSHPLPAEITGFLNEYTVYSHGRIRFTARDPVKSNLADEMESLGIYPQTIRIIENNQAVTTDVYTGITIEYRDRIEVLPLVFSMDTLEYDITSKILNLVQGRDKELGVIVGDSSKQWNVDYVLLDSELKRAGYTVRLFLPGEEIPARLPALFVLGGAEDLDEWDLYRINWYIQNGGNVLFAQDGLFLDLQNNLAIRQINDMGLLAMISSCGAAILPAMVVDRSSLQISFQGSGGSQDIRTIPYPLWISVTGQNMNRSSPLTGGLSGLCLYWASPVELAPPPGVNAQILFTSSAESWTILKDFTADPLVYQNLDAFLEQQGTGTVNGARILGAALSGVFPDFFAGLPKPQREGSQSGLPDTPAVGSVSRIIVTGDSNFASSMMEAGSGQAANLGFLIRAADWLCNDELAIGLRREQQPGLDRITDAGKKKSAMDFSVRLNVIAVPVLIVLAGFIIIQRRKKLTGAPDSVQGSKSDDI